MAVNPMDFPQSWDVIIIGSTDSPGIVEVTGFKRGNEWDIKKGKGTVGATLTYTSAPPAQGSFKFTLWKKEHFDEWENFRKLLKYDPTKKSVQAVDVYYPSLADIDVFSIVIENIGAIEHEGKGKYGITVDAIEYKPVPKKSATSSPTGSQSTPKDKKNTPGDVADPVADAQQKEIAELLKKASEP